MKDLAAAFTGAPPALAPGFGWEATKASICITRTRPASPAAGSRSLAPRQARRRNRARRASRKMNARGAKR